MARVAELSRASREAGAPGETSAWSAGRFTRATGEARATCSTHLPRASRDAGGSAAQEELSQHDQRAGLEPNASQATDTCHVLSVEPEHEKLVKRTHLKCIAQCCSPFRHRSLGIQPERSIGQLFVRSRYRGSSAIDVT